MLSSLDVSSTVLVAVTAVSWLFLLHFIKKVRRRKHLPGGSLGFPLIGESVSFLQAQSQDRTEEWIQERVLRYGSVFKTSLIGSPTVIITGQAGNKFVMGADYEVLAVDPPKSFKEIAGRSHLFEITKNRYMRVKEGMISFLKSESLQNHVNDMECVIISSLLRETRDKDIVKGVDVMQRVIFDVACTILFGIHDKTTRESLLSDFKVAAKAFWSIPIYFPGTTFKRGVDARQRINDTMLPIIKKKKEDLINGIITPKSDVIACLLSTRIEDEGPVTEIEVIDYFIVLMIASYDTTAVLSSLMIWKLAGDEDIYKKVKEEHMAIVSERKAGEGKLAWSEIQKMKYTWRVAQELMRTIPPVFGSFRKVVQDTRFAGYDIPKGWQVLWVSSTTHMNESIFDNPNTFDPSRFETQTKRIAPYTYIPFGAGTHMCIGIEYARVETLTIIHHLMTKFEWSQVNPDEKIIRMPMPYPSMGLPIKLKPIAPLSFS